MTSSMILGNLRLPYETNGDIFAQIKALDSGEQRLHELLTRYGPIAITTAFSEMKVHAAGIFRSHLRQIPDGTAEFTTISILIPWTSTQAISS